jgi:collagen type IV alpha-3-binding protein
MADLLRIGRRNPSKAAAVGPLPPSPNTDAPHPQQPPTPPTPTAAASAGSDSEPSLTSPEATPTATRSTFPRLASNSSLATPSLLSAQHPKPARPNRGPAQRHTRSVSDVPRNILSDASSDDERHHSDTEVQVTAGPRLPEREGVLAKWTNYIHGWQERYVVLQEGTLSYFKSAREKAKVCRGTWPPRRPLASWRSPLGE